MNLREVLENLVPSPEECRRAAEQLRLDNPGLTPEQVARKAVNASTRWAVGVGAATGLTASPFTLLPAAVAEAIALLRIEGKLAGTIAALLDPDSIHDPDLFRQEVIRVVFPAAFSQALRSLGMKAGEHATKTLVRRFATRAVTAEATEHAVKRLGVRLTEKAVTTKAIPLVGAGIGAAWNYAELRAIGQRAIAYHTAAPGPVESATETAKSWWKRGRRRVRLHPKGPSRG